MKHPLTLKVERGEVKVVLYQHIYPGVATYWPVKERKDVQD